MTSILIFLNKTYKVDGAGTLRIAPSIDRIIILSATPYREDVEWHPYRGSGMNAERLNSGAY